MKHQITRPMAAPRRAALKNAMRMTFLGTVSLLIFSNGAFAEDWKAKVFASKRTGSRISGLVLDSNVTTVSRRTLKSGREVAVARIQGRLNREGWGIYYRKKWILKPNSRKRSFSFLVALTGRVKVIKLKAVQSGNGGVQNGKIYVKFQDYAAFMQEGGQRYAGGPQDQGAENEPSSTSFALSTGPTIVSYEEKGVADFSITQLTVKGHFKWNFAPPKWDLGLSAFYTPFSISNQLSNTSVKFLGFNARVGYRLDWLDSPWDLRIMGGMYYTTMQVTGDAFGFKNMLGPQIFPVVRRSLANGDWISFYTKFAMVSGLTLSNREIAGGGGYAKILDNGNALLFNLDIANLAFDVDNADVNSTSTSFSVGYGF